VQRPAGELEMSIVKIEYGDWLGAPPEGSEQAGEGR
jgi:hypothetical protein